ncbi:MAG: hypothetical protein KGY75_09545, partial [Candidatus Cloacimonetes bacterium]|nr:hypothetical protein [Candidatus Cloacimonadota bacterium]
MKLNKKVIKDLLSFENIWMLVIILTIVYFIVHPGKIFQGGRKFKADHAKLNKAEYYIPNPQKENSFILLRKGEESTKISFYKYPLHLKRNTDFVGTKLSFRGRKMTDVLINDEQVFFTLLQMPATMSLVTLQAEDFTYNMEELYNLDSLFYFLQDTTITSNNTKFYEHEIFDDESQRKTYVKEFKDGYRIYFKKTFFTKLQRYFDFKNLDNSPRYNYLVSLLNNQIDTVSSFDHYDTYDIVNFFKARNFYQQKLFKFMDKKFLPIRANILSSADVNGDGYDELLVQLNLGRFIANPLLCYDVHNSTILWQRRDLPGIVQIEAADIDEDGKEEFLGSTYAPCCEMPLNHKKNRAKLKFFSYFFILGSEGEVEKINGNRAFIQSKQGFYDYVFVNLQKQKKIVLG